jgi:murein DD-endopeptidase MepM/ murein hydrolase activator NlpD
MVVPDARGTMRRFHVRGTQLAWAAGVVALLAVMALAAPVFMTWNRGLASERDTLRAERDQLEARSAEVEQTLSELRTQLDLFEQRTEKLAFLAGLELPSLGLGAQGYSRGVDELGTSERVELFRSEASDLADAGTLLERRLETVEQAYGEQSERLSRIPSIVPVRGLIGSGFGWRRDPFTGRRQYHRGLDVSAPEGTPIHAPADGIVVKTETNGGYGKVIYISHGDGLVTRYGHVSAYKARPGQRVSRGDVVALVGNTGRSTAPHLHYEVLLQGKPVNPMKFISDEGLFY